jgi:hypothetical protein
MTGTEQPTTNRPPQGVAGQSKPKAKKEEELDDSATQEALEHEGDPDEGHYSPEELADQVSPRVISARDRRAYLLSQAIKNEAANDEVNAREADLINERREGIANYIIDPDRLREESLKQSLDDVDQHTREGAKKRAAARKEIADAREKVGDLTPVPGRTEVGKEKTKP